MNIVSQDARVLQDDIAEIKANVTMEHYRQLFNKPFVKASNNWVTLCCKSGEKTPSLNIFSDDMGWKCFSCGAGGDFIDAVEYVNGCDKKTAIDTARTLVLGCGNAIVSDTPKNTAKRKPEAKNERISTKHTNIKATYVYTDENGKPVHVNVRFEEAGKAGKTFLQGTAAQYEVFKTGKYCKLDMNGVKRYLYKLPELLESLQTDNPAFWVEGEKCVEALTALGLVATTSGSATTWNAHKQDYISSLAGNAGTFYILPDNNTPGFKYAQSVANDLVTAGHKVKVIILHGLKDGEDIVEWLAIDGNTKDKLLELANSAEWFAAADAGTEGQPQESSYDGGTEYKDYLKELTQKGYIVRSGMLGRYKTMQDGSQGEFVPISNYFLCIEKSIRFIDGDMVTRGVKIYGYLINREKLPSITISAKDFNAFTFPVEKWGAKLILYNQASGQKLKVLTQELGMDSPEESIYTSTGFYKINGKRVYVHSGGAVGMDGVKVDLSENGKYNLMNNYKLPDASPDETKAAKLVLEMFDVADNNLVYPLFASVALAPLASLFESAGVYLDVVPFLVGATQSGKSSIAGLFLSMFGNFDRKHFPANFQDTANALGRVTYLAKDILLVIDDFYPATNQYEQKELTRKAGILCRSYGDSNGRSRMSSDLKMISGNKPRGLAIVTGEQKPSLTESGLARFFFLSATRENINFEKLELVEEKKDLLPQITRLYILWIMDNWDVIKNDCKANIANFRNKLKSLGSGRACDGASLLLYGVALWLRFLVDKGCIVQGEEGKRQKEAWNAIKQLLIDNIKGLEIEKPSNKFMDGLREMLAAGAVQLANVNDQPIGERLNYIGCEDSEYIYLFPKITYTSVKKYLENEGGGLNLASGALWNMLYAEGILLTSKDTSGQWSEQVCTKCFGKSRFLKFSKKVLMDLEKNA